MTAPLWTKEDAARATGGQAVGPDWTANGVSIDSRTVEPGDLFVALVGPKTDGHRFVARALAQGATAAVVSTRPDDVAEDAPLIEVDDTLSALWALGRAARARTHARIVAVTGSVGKTGTKEALRLALGEQGATAANVKSFNNHWGVPLSLARMPAAAVFGVFELGMNDVGEIEALSKLVRPHVALITTVEAAHLARFDDVTAIADAKAEVFTGLEADGVAVLNRDNDHFERLAAAASACGVDRIVSFGGHEKADVHLVDSAGDAGGSRVVADIDGRRIGYRIGVPGRHWVANSLGVLAVVSALGADVAKAASALAELTPARGRGVEMEVAWGNGAITVLDDSYNANPASMRAAIALLVDQAAAKGARAVAVLGDMRELGARSAALHGDLAPVLERAGVEAVYTAGAEMQALAARLPAALSAGHAADAEQLAPLVAAGLRAGDVVLVKGSNGMAMGRVITALNDGDGSKQEMGR